MLLEYTLSGFLLICAIAYCIHIYRSGKKPVKKKKLKPSKIEFVKLKKADKINKKKLRVK